MRSRLIPIPGRVKTHKDGQPVDWGGAFGVGKPPMTFARQVGRPPGAKGRLGIAHLKVGEARAFPVRDVALRGPLKDRLRGNIRRLRAKHPDRKYGVAITDTGVRVWREA